jgi:hypothetical protein
MHRLQYLESLDSVRSLGDQRVQANDLPQLHADMEAIATLAVGRSVVLPEPQALDSRIAMRTVSKILRIRDEIGSADRPISFHTRDGQSLATALSRLRDRALDRSDSYVSSAFPDRDAVQNLPEALASPSPSEDPRYSSLRLMLREHESVGSVHPEPFTSFSLAESVKAFLDGQVNLTRRDREVRDAANALQETIKELCPRKDGTWDTSGLNNRSVLRSEVAWPHDSGGRAPREMVSEDELAGLVEFVDTLYNLKVASSIGPIPFTASTVATLGQELSVNRLLAQDLAVATFASAPHMDVVSDNQGDVSNHRPRTDPIFDVAVASASSVNDRTVVERLTSQSEDALRRILQERSDPSSEFGDSLRTMQRARDDGKPQVLDIAVSRHIDLLTSLLADGHRVTVRSTFATQALAGAALFGAQNESAMASAHLPFLLRAGVYLTVMTSAQLGLVGGAKVQREIGRQRVAGALGEVIRVAWV